LSGRGVGWPTFGFEPNANALIIDAGGYSGYRLLKVDVWRENWPGIYSELIKKSFSPAMVVVHRYDQSAYTGIAAFIRFQVETHAAGNLPIIKVAIMYTVF
jgi:hypothetical protein